MGDRTGSPNRNTQFLTNRLKAMFGDDFEPIIKAAENAVRMQSIANEHVEMLEDPDIDADVKLELRANEFNCRKECVTAWEKIGQYCSPKLKAIEVSGDKDSPLNGKWTVEFINATPKG